MLDWPFKLKCSSGFIYNTFITHIFPWFCAWGGCAIICCLFHINPGKPGFCFFSYCAVLWCAQIIEYILARWSYSFVCALHYLIIIINADVSVSIALLKWLRSTFCRKCSQLHFMQNIGFCVYSWLISPNVIGGIGVLCLTIIVKSEVLPICHCLELGHETIFAL